MKKLLQILGTIGLVLVACFDVNAMNLQIREGRPVVDGVYVNGRGPYRFLVDTGTTLNHLDIKLAKSIGLEPTFHTTLTSSTGAIPASGSIGLTVTLDSAQTEGQTFLFAGLDAIQRSWPDIQGILGQEFLSHFDYLLDMRGKRLEFGHRESDGKEVQAPFTMNHGRAVVATSLGSLVLDSGAHLLTRFGVKGGDATFAMRTVTGTVELGSMKSTLIIADHSFWRGDAVAVPHSSEAGVDGLLPTSFFKSVYVSNSEGYVIFQ